MPRLSGCFALAALLIVAEAALAGGIEEIKGAGARDRIAATRGLVLVDLYADW